MSKQAGTGTLEGGTGGSDPRSSQSTSLRASMGVAEPHEGHHGRPVSWVAVTIIFIGFVVGGVAMIAGPTWWAFWAGAGIAVVGCLLAAATRIFDDWY
jgi:hypothetical protein